MKEVKTCNVSAAQSFKAYSLRLDPGLGHKVLPLNGGAEQFAELETNGELRAPGRSKWASAGAKWAAGARLEPRPPEKKPRLEPSEARAAAAEAEAEEEEVNRGECMYPRLTGTLGSANWQQA